MKIYFIRHGHADHNDAYDSQKTTDVYKSFKYRHSKLTEKGIEEIQTIQLPIKPERVYSSPLIRCIETSRILFGENETLYLYDGLMETQGPYPCNWRDNYDIFMRSLSRFNLVNISDKYYPSKKHETLDEMKIRANSCLTKIKDHANGFDTIAIITHNDWLESIFDRKFSNGEVYCVDI